MGKIRVWLCVLILRKVGRWKDGPGLREERSERRSDGKVGLADLRSNGRHRGLSTVILLFQSRKGKT